MPTFRYKGRKPTGEAISGEIETLTLSDAVRFLQNQSIIPLDIVEIKVGFRPLEMISKLRLPLFKVSSEELMIFCRQMGTLISAGVTLITSLQQLAKSTKSKTFSRALQDINKRISSGQSLSKSLAAYPHIFSPLFVNIIEVGENTGRLREAFKQLTIYYGNEILNKRRLQSAIRYPLIVIIAIIAAMLVLDIAVIPKFVGIFKSLKAELPLATRIMISSSNFVLNYWLFLTVAALFLFVGWGYLLMIPQVRAVWDKYKLLMPVFGNLQKRIIIAQFTWGCGLILRSGVNISKAIQLAAQIANNVYLSKKMLLIRNDIEQGKSFTQATEACGLFPLSAIQMISVGEQTGCLEDMLDEIAKYYDDEIDFDMRRLSDLMQPILLSIVGAMVCVLAVGIYLPMWDLIKHVK